MKKLSLIAGLTAMIMSSGSMSLELGDMLYESVKQSVKINTADHEPTVLDISKEFNHRYPTNLFTLIINNAEKAKASNGEGDGVFYDAKNNSLIGQDPRNDESPTLKATLFKSGADHYLFMLTATMELGGLYSDESHYFDIDWKTGEMMTVANVFPTNKPVSAKEASAGYDFDDKENKQGIVKQLLTFLDSNKSKLQYLQDLKLGDAFVGRKVVAVFFRNKDWIVDTNALGVPIRRRVFLNIISELGSGITVAEDYEVWNAYQGNGKYSGLYEFGVTRKNGSSDYYKRTIANQWMITDWVHDPNADPMAEFK